MTMTPQTFHDLLEEAVSQPPPPPGLWRELAEGRRLVRRRRVLSAVSAAAAVAVVTTGTALALQVDLDKETPQERVDRSASDADLMESCRNGAHPPPPARHEGARPGERGVSNWATDQIFAPEPPRVISVVRTRHRAVLAIESAEGRFWAECVVHFADGGFESVLTVFDGTQRATDFHRSEGAGCWIAETTKGTCEVWAVWLVDRLPAEVAAVRYDLGDGTSQTRPTTEGYVVLNVLNELPPGGSSGAHGTIRGFDAIRQVTYLDDAGTALAAARWDGLGNGPQQRVEGLPPLHEYPSRRASL